MPFDTQGEGRMSEIRETIRHIVTMQLLIALVLVENWAAQDHEK